jgi:hypothetical protein
VPFVRRAVLSLLASLPLRPLLENQLTIHTGVILISILYRVFGCPMWEG